MGVLDHLLLVAVFSEAILLAGAVLWRRLGHQMLANPCSALLLVTGSTAEPSWKILSLLLDAGLPLLPCSAAASTVG